MTTGGDYWVTADTREAGSPGRGLVELKPIAYSRAVQAPVRDEGDYQINPPVSHAERSGRSPPGLALRCPRDGPLTFVVLPRSGRTVAPGVLTSRGTRSTTQPAWDGHNIRAILERPGTGTSARR